MRIDKYIWTVRLFKSRSQATKACAAEHVLVNNKTVKPSFTVTERDEVAIKTGAFYRTYKVLAFPKNRVGAKLVADYLVETTSEEVKVQIEEISRINRENRNLGVLGRPTKKNRRDLNKFKGY